MNINLPEEVFKIRLFSFEFIVILKCLIVYLFLIGSKNVYCICRYSPLTPPTTNWFPVRGVTIAEGSSHCNQFICNVELKNLNVHSSGSYRCEVSGDAPEFKLIDKTANMTVGGKYVNDVFLLLSVINHKIIQ